MLKLEVLRRANMLLKSEEALCLSPRVHDILNNTNAASISIKLQELINQGELITLRQLVYYMNNLGLQIDLTANHFDFEWFNNESVAEYFDTNTGELIFEFDYRLNHNMVSNIPYAVTQVMYWVDEFTLCVHAEPLRDTVMKACMYYSQPNEDLEDDYEDIE